MTCHTLGQFLQSADAIPFLFSLALALSSPIFSKFVEEDVVKRHLPPDLKSSEQDIVDFSVDAVRKVQLISSIFIATINAAVVVAKGVSWGIYAVVLLLFGLLLMILKWARMSAYDFQDKWLGIKKLRWVSMFSIILNVFLIFLGFVGFVARLRANHH
jgi:hypothetical protein